MTQKTLKLTQFFITPTVVTTWQVEQWQQLLSQAYASQLVARVYWLLTTYQLTAYIPTGLEWHFSSAYTVFQAHRDDVRREIAQITSALSTGNIQPVFLKGAAYILAEDDCHFGRLFADVDIYVEKSSLANTEQLLRWHGWVSRELDAHDERYYRDWMHEIPPMGNSKTNMTIDVHHNLVPLVSRIKLDAVKLHERLINYPTFQLLSLEDRILHSAVHLLLDGEFQHGFRDLHDLYLLLNQAMRDEPEFISILQIRAQQLGFELITWYLLRLMVDIFDMKLSPQTLQQSDQVVRWLGIRRIVLYLFKRVLLPDQQFRRSSRFRHYAWLLYIRSHWLKMPVHLLIPHLCYKALITPYLQRKKNNQLAANRE